MKRIIVVDTSYLLELFRVPNCHTERGHDEVQQRFAQGIERGWTFVVPTACIFECLNHVADIRDGTARRQLAQLVVDNVRKSLEFARPWLIPRAMENRELDYLCHEFVQTYAQQGVGLTDAAVIAEAKTQHCLNQKSGKKVHIWTMDLDLKAREPDKEAGAFVGDVRA